MNWKLLLDLASELPPFGGMFVQENACVIMHNSIVVKSGNFSEGKIGSMLCGRAKEVREEIGKRGISGVRVDETTVFFKLRESEIVVPSTEVPGCPAIEKVAVTPLRSWEKDILREDFLGRTTHIKAGMDGWCRGKAGDEEWRPNKPGADEFAGLIYDVQAVNSVLRECPEISRVNICDMYDFQNTPLCVTAGDFQFVLPRIYYDNLPQD